jgi:hypothetical protein
MAAVESFRELLVGRELVIAGKLNYGLSSGGRMLNGVMKTL